MAASTPCSASSFSFFSSQVEQAALIADLECSSLLLRAPKKISSESRNERQNGLLKNQGGSCMRLVVVPN